MIEIDKNPIPRRILSKDVISRVGQKVK